MTKYFADGPPADPLRVEAGRTIADANDQVWLVGTRLTEDYNASEGTLKRSPCPANTDIFTREIVSRYNAHAQLVELLRTVLRETSPASAAGFVPKQDLPRIYQHLQKHLNLLGIDTAVTGGPAVLEIPSLPEGLPPEWEAGYKAAWDTPQPPEESEP
jgi:hypothetical protein